MTDDSRAQGGLVCIGAVVLAALFLAGLLRESYWAVALPVAALVLSALALVFWVGWTIATVSVEPESVEPHADSDAPGADDRA